MSTVKISWGVRIALLYAGFVAIIVTLVVGSMKQNFDLVSKDYYQQELEYQSVINAGKNQAALSSPIGIHANEQTVAIDFPAEFKDEIVKGTIHFYSKVNSAWDKNYEITTANNSMTIPRNELNKTVYLMKIKWTTADKSYYQESELNLTR